MRRLVRVAFRPAGACIACALVLAVTAPIDAIALTTIKTRTSPTAGVDAANAGASGAASASPSAAARRGAALAAASAAAAAGATASSGTTTPTTTYVPSGGTPPAATTPAPGATGATPTTPSPATAPPPALVNKRLGKASTATAHKSRRISTLA